MSVRDGLLALLDDGPRHGYQLKIEFEAATGGVWALNVGQVYTTLDRLQRDGLVVEETGDSEHKQYALTADGREALGAWWETVPVDDPPPRDELQLKVLMAIERGSDHAIDVITRQRTALTRLLQQRRRNRREGVGPARRGQRSSRSAATTDTKGQAAWLAAELVTDALIVRAEADLRWLDLCEARLGKAAAAGSG